MDGWEGNFPDSLMSLGTNMCQQKKSYMILSLERFIRWRMCIERSPCHLSSETQGIDLVESHLGLVVTLVDVWTWVSRFRRQAPDHEDLVTFGEDLSQRSNVLSRGSTVHLVSTPGPLPPRPHLVRVPLPRPLLVPVKFSTSSVLPVEDRLPPPRRESIQRPNVLIYLPSTHVFFSLICCLVYSNLPFKVNPVTQETILSTLQTWLFTLRPLVFIQWCRGLS